jgi:ketosteroid isomerase-like protein
MTDPRRNVELVRGAFAAFERGDVEAINRLLDPGVEVSISHELANAGTWSGVEGFWTSIGSWLEAWDEYRIELRDLDTPDDRNVIAEAHQTAIGRASGVPVELTTFFLFEIRDELCTRYGLYATREAALAAIESAPR